MKEILIDFMVWFDSIPTEEVLCDHEVLIDKYLKSINCPMEKPRTLGENEQTKEVCSHEASHKRMRYYGMHYCEHCLKDLTAN